MPSICWLRLNAETRTDTKSPYSGAIVRQGRTEFEPWRLRGGDSRARTGDPPASHRTGLRAGNGNFLRRDRPAKVDSSLAETDSETRARKPRFPRMNCEIACEGCARGLDPGTR
jgi:hypothetical protein